MIGLRQICKTNDRPRYDRLLTFVDSTINDRRSFKCLIRSLQTRSWDKQLTFRNFSVTEQNVIVCFVRINAFHANINVNDNKQLFWTRTSISRLRQNDHERAMGMVQAGITHQAVTDHFNVSRITISRLMIRLRQICKTNDRVVCNGLVSNSSLNHTHRSLMVILTES
jgi:hypothetical protein